MSKRAFPLLPLLSLAVVLTAAILPAFASRVQDRGLFGVTHTEPLREEAGAQPTAPPQRIDLVRRGRTQDDSGLIFVVQQPPEKEQQTALTDARAALQTLVDYGVLPADFPAASCEYQYNPVSRLLYRDRTTGESVSVYVMLLSCTGGSVELTMDVETGAVYALSSYRPPDDPDMDERTMEKMLLDSAAMAEGFAKQLGVSLTLDPVGAAYGYEDYLVEGASSRYFFHGTTYAIDIVLSDPPAFSLAADSMRSTSRFGDDAVSINHN
ncbi:hypothetical protein RWV98_04560 [Agathobaculum sp. NTUH-O15-33]|uniref:hypothetical protein n=1 Tax=Agathobaculum sp. NTUH-O15-33 TaxID=3079302 RepID=UPI0029589292|nr:hypothetical protein [Agathobaculum sp. NTUH-O15-33]WNX85552.1 hypothetical protein RWV98_04560 [Agathobaculum sp. NTUH-O15-33]